MAVVGCLEDNVKAPRFRGRDVGWRPVFQIWSVIRTLLTQTIESNQEPTSPWKDGEIYRDPLCRARLFSPLYGDERYRGGT